MATTKISLSLFHPRTLPDQGIVLVTGGEKAGKTYMSLFLALMKRTGTSRPLVHVSPTHPMPIDVNDPYPLFYSSHTSIPYPLPPQSIVLVDDILHVQDAAGDIAEWEGILYIVCCRDAHVPEEWLQHIDAVCMLANNDPSLYYSQWLYHCFEHEQAALDVIRLVTCHPKQYCGLMFAPKQKVLGNIRADMNVFTFERV